MALLCNHKVQVIKKAEGWRTDAFKLWSWRRLSRVPGTARRSNQSILKEINPEYSLEGLMLKLKLQYFDHLIWRANSLEKTLMLGKIEGRKRRRQQRMRWLDSITNSMNMNLSKCQEIVKDSEGLAAVHGVAKSRIWLRNWTTMINPITMETQDFFNKGCQLQTQFFSTELRGEISASSTNPPHLLLNREYHVKPSLYPELRVNFLVHKEKKNDNTSKIPGPYSSFPKVKGLNSKWSPIQWINSRARDWQTTIPEDLLDSLWSTLGEMQGVQRWVMERQAQVQVWTRVILSKCKFPKHLHTHSCLLIPQNHQVKANLPKPFSEWSPKKASQANPVYSKLDRKFFSKHI